MDVKYAKDYKQSIISWKCEFSFFIIIINIIIIISIIIIIIITTTTFIFDR